MHEETVSPRYFASRTMVPFVRKITSFATHFFNFHSRGSEQDSGYFPSQYKV